MIGCVLAAFGFGMLLGAALGRNDMLKEFGMTWAQYRASRKGCNATGHEPMGFTGTIEKPSI